MCHQFEQLVVNFGPKLTGSMPLRVDQLTLDPRHGSQRTAMATYQTMASDYNGTSCNYVITTKTTSAFLDFPNVLARNYQASY